MDIDDGDDDDDDAQYNISVYHARISKIVYARFNVPFPHLHRLYSIRMDVQNFILQPSMNC